MHKWERYCILREDHRIHAYLPETRLLTEETLWQMLSKTDAVILKPAAGSGGAGIILVFSAGDDRFIIQEKLTKQSVNRDDLFSCLTQTILKEFASFVDSSEVNKILSESYLIQHRIAIAEIEQRPFDIRVMVQRKNGSPWKVTGKLAKLAADGYAITNVNLGATILPVETAIQRSSLHTLSQDALLSELDQVALLAVERLQQHYPNIGVIGFDMCFDMQGKLWIIEANFRPDDYIFLELEDKTMYQTIQAYR
ncbi:hypothetical protein G3578_16785 [Brevibacillus sp. SYP-B805]|uniref:YheC/YheD family protein n=1 Tax=Brevibacillus sp. SYP-B805 TaxID=1578199 RepID=UPI0013EDF03B|nr:YheC/YheD family protein [Brevibacillus sp. SYP-B805]NGQ96823.1 hypothetical protein [Brevibacillus sp. SYP-B805]